MRLLLTRAPQAARWLADRLFPRQCPFCGALLGTDAAEGTHCPACAPEEKRLRHTPPRLPEGEHDLSAVTQAMAAYYYADTVRLAILRTKRVGCPWYARELADRMAVLLFGALPAPCAGALPLYAGLPTLPLYNCIVPVPPRQPLPGVPGFPLLLAQRLGAVLGIPVEQPLYLKTKGTPQKSLDRAARQRNARESFACLPGTDLSGKRVLLVDDIITTGATVSACALALLESGAEDVTAAALATAEELPKEKRKKGGST